jgi:hypothetical protein
MVATPAIPCFGVEDEIMSRTSRMFFLLAFLPALSFSAAFGCQGEVEDFAPCVLDEKVKELGLCAVVGGPNTAETCIAPEHPWCPYGACLSWAGGDPYCTISCGVDAECLEGSVCRYFGGSTSTGDCYCVQDDGSGSVLVAESNCPVP